MTATPYYIAVSADTIEWLEEILTRCGRNNTLTKQKNGWEIRDQQGNLVDSDADFNALFWRAYNWEEDVPGYEGLLWQSPARMGGHVCIKGTRIPADLIAACVKVGEDVYENYDITEEQVAAVTRWHFSTQEKVN